MSYFKNKSFWFWGFMVLLIFNISIFGSMAYHMYSMHNGFAHSKDYHHSIKKGTHPKHSKGTKSLMKRLDLSPEQQKELRKIRKEHFTKMKALKKELYIAQHQLFDEAGNEVIDSVAIAKYRKQMMDIQGGIADESLQFLGEMKKHLSPKQQELMKEHFREKFNN
jgi:Spy/CpxP family protein refolding chaperone